MIFDSKMIDFKILKKSKKSRARLGVLRTPHGEVETPALVGVATQATVKALTCEEVKIAKSQILISNTYHLHIRPGEEVVEKAGKLHKFMNWGGALMTDSGGFQVFSLGFGKDYGVGKTFREEWDKAKTEITKGQQPQNMKITKDGVWFRSYLDGRELFLGSKESIRIQERLGADIIFAFDECTPTLSNHEYAKDSMLKTHDWAAKCVKAKKSDQALYGIVQGSKFKDLREESAKFISSLDVAGFGIGGDLGESKKGTKQVLDWVIPNLDERKPRHLLGIGKLDDMKIIIQGGADTFDCTVPTHYARRGVAFTSLGRLDIDKTRYLKDQKPLDKNCKCPVCQTYSRSYLCHLFRARELTAFKFLTLHNLFYFNTVVENLRKDIKNNKI